MVAGFLVDSVLEVVQLPESSVKRPPPFAGAVESHCVKAVGKVDDMLLILMNLQKMFLTHEESGEGCTLLGESPG